MEWLVLHFPALGLELFQGTDSQQPAVLVEDNRVCLCNDTAQQAGIRPGTTLATARSIANDLMHLQRQPDLETQRLEALADALYGLTPDIALAPPASLVIDLKGSERLFANPEQLCQHAFEEARTMGHRATIRRGSTPAAALALALTAHRQLSKVPLSVLPLLNPDIRDVQVERFLNMGLRSIGDVLALPAESLARRFGAAIAHTLDRVAGRRGDPQTFIEPKERFEQTLHLLDPIRSKQGLAGPMLRLAKRLERWLIGRQLAASELHWTFSSASTQLQGSAMADARAPVMTVGFAQPLTGARRFLRLSQTRLEPQVLPGEVISVVLAATATQPLVGQPTTLFPEPGMPDGLDAAAHTPNDLLDQLRARLGDESCRRLEARAQHHPGWLVRQPRQQGFTNKRVSEGSAVPALATEPRTAAHRPLWLRQQPRPVALRELTLLHGPERIQTGWWHQGTARDYYIACRKQLSGPSYCWVYRDQDKNWYLHGYFA